MKPKKHKRKCVVVKCSTETEERINTVLKPKKYKKKICRVEQSSTTEECVQTVLKPKKHKKKVITCIEDKDDVCKVIRVKEKCAKPVKCAPVCNPCTTTVVT